MVGIARESGLSLLDILNDILDLSKIEAGKLTIEGAEMSPRAIIQGACDAAQVVARRKGITLQYIIDESVPGLVVSDPVRVRQILMNLVNNAVKFTECGGVTVRVSLDEGRHLRMEVKDTGIGLTGEQRERLFKPFSQADDSTTRKFGGSGLGLSICQKLVERMDGEIGVISEPGLGSTFWFYVTIGHTDKQPDDTHEVRLNGIRVLLIDKDPLTAKETMELFVNAGADVVLTRESQKAFQILTQQPFEVVVLEQHLDGSRGLDLAPAIRVIQPHASLILYTEEEGGMIAEAAEQGKILYLPRTTPYVQVLMAVKSAAAGAKPLRKGGLVKGRILIAEDTASVRQILEVQLRSLDIEVDFVEDGKQALEKLQRGRYSLLISDLHMPELDGYGLVKEWREREVRRGKPERLPIVALTADVLIGDQSRFLEAGFDDYLAKPVSRNVLHQVVYKWLSGDDVVQEISKPAILEQDLASENPIDHARLVEILGFDDPEVIKESMAVFVDTARETFAALESAYGLGDVKAARGPAHSLKGSARMAGAVKLGDLCAEVDAAAKKDTLLTNKLEEIQGELARVLKYVNSFYLEA
jgi:CheY-like chemotaxis protein